jgi:NAD(P)-dependent dehydrogenase (short-subunit alcohol dehydrogenase family)
MPKNKTRIGTVVTLAGAAAGLALLRSALSRKYILAGKTVFITGGSLGLGLVLAREFGKRRARMVICARDQAELARASDLQGRGCTVETFTCDVADKTQVDKTIEAVRQRLGPIDILVNNAGVISVGPLESMTLEDYQESLATHFWGPLYTMMGVLPDMRRRKEGRIVNISSIGGTISVPHLVPYCAGKFALAGLSEGVRAEALRDSVYVTTVYPGLMRTGSPRNAYFKGKHRAEYAWFSISDALPLFSISAERAARSIVSACERGSARLVVSLPAKVAAMAFHLFPASASVLSWVERMLPGPGESAANASGEKTAHLLRRRHR